MKSTVLMLMIEPTPYILGFIRELKSTWNGKVEVAFVGKNLSQPWDECVIEEKLLSADFFKAALELFKSLRPENYSLVHLAGWSHPLIFVALLICAVRGIQTSVESDTPQRTESSGWRPGIKRILYPLVFRLPRLFLPGGSRQAAYFRNYGVSEDRIRIAHMTVDIATMSSYYDNFTPQRRKDVRAKFLLKEEQVVFLFVGRLESHKGIRELLDAYRVLRERLGSACALVIAGNGVCRPEVERAAQEMPDVVVAGRVTGTDLMDIYASMDVFVLPSLIEPWGLVVNEAMAFGLPVIASDAVGCVDDLVKPGITGTIVPAGNSAALADAMERFVSDGKLRQAWGAASRERIRPWTLRHEAECVSLAWQEVM